MENQQRQNYNRLDKNSDAKTVRRNEEVGHVTTTFLFGLWTGFVVLIKGDKMKLDRNELTRKQNIVVALFILVSFFGAFYLQSFGEFAIFAPIFGITGMTFWIIHLRSKNREKLRTSNQKVN